MERVRRLRALWSWLPAFRVAAETEHLPTASELLHLSASSISRTVRLLEEDLGRPLFERDGRAMRLNREGRIFLEAVRDAMRIVDEGVEMLAGAKLQGTVEISAPRDLADVFVVPITRELSRSAPDLIASVREERDADINGLLLRGRLDVALLLEPEPHDAVTVELLAPITHGVYAPKAHPLARRRKVKLKDMASEPFAVPPRDAWPIERPRRIGARVADLSMAAEVCAEAGLLSALPDVLARAHPRSKELFRLPTDPMRPSTLYAAYRRPLASHPRTERVLEALRARSRAVAAQ